MSDICKMCRHAEKQKTNWQTSGVDCTLMVFTLYTMHVCTVWEHHHLGASLFCRSKFVIAGSSKLYYEHLQPLDGVCAQLKSTVPAWVVLSHFHSKWVLLQSICLSLSLSETGKACRCER